MNLSYTAKVLLSSTANEIGKVYMRGAIAFTDKGQDGAWTKCVEEADREIGRAVRLNDAAMLKRAIGQYRKKIKGFIEIYRRDLVRGRLQGDR